MKKYIIVAISFLIAFTNYSCTSDNQNDDSDSGKPAANVEANKATLTINGNGIWVRSKPVSGDVVMKLNEGNECIIHEKSELDTVKENVDYWYKIEFDNQQGWVFGSQTSKSLNKSIDVFEATLLDVVKAIASKNYDKINSYIDASTGVYKLYNPGLLIAVDHQNRVDEGIIDFDLNPLQNSPEKTDKLPEFDCGEEAWTKEGVFITDINDFKEISTAIKNLKQYNDIPYTKEQMAAAKKAEQSIEKALKITDSIITLYFGKKNNNWYLIAIDAVTPCDA